MRAWTRYESPLGTLTLVAGPAGIRALHFPEGAPRLHPSAEQALPAAIAQLDQYFAGDRRAFDLDLDLAGTPFQQLVWARLREIPYGATITYGGLADLIPTTEFPAALRRFERVRFAAAAVGRTPVPILVPCHRVIAADGSLTGYRGGLERKRTLLDLEGRSAVSLQPRPNVQLTF
jgi:methylated-DNA-[protein]-cysteine S-methyltransferase